MNRSRSLFEVHVPTGPPPDDAVASSAAIRALVGLWSDPDACAGENLDWVQRGEGLASCLRASQERSPVGAVRLEVDEILFLNRTAAVVAIRALAT